MKNANLSGKSMRVDFGLDSNLDSQNLRHARDSCENLDSNNSLDSDTILSARNLAHKFEVLLYSDVNLEIKERESIAILGVSGSGKSTLLNNLSTFLKPTSGEVRLFGRDIYALRDDEILKMRQDDIGIIFQSHYLFRGFSARENLEVASILTRRALDFELLKNFGIDNILDQPIGKLSGGQQQRLSIARVLLKKPRIIFADEPTGNLDKKTAQNVMNVVFDYIKTARAAMFIVTHDINIAQLCDKIYYLQDSKLVLNSG